MSLDGSLEKEGIIIRVSGIDNGMRLFIICSDPNSNWWKVLIILTREVPCCHNSGSHIVDLGYWNGPVVHCVRKIGTPIQVLVGHGHIKASHGTRNTSVLAKPVTQYKPLKIQLGFQEAIEGFAVMARITIVEPLVGTHCKSMIVWLVNDNVPVECKSRA